MDGKELKLLVGLCIWQLLVVSMVSCNMVFKVEHKYKGGRATLQELSDHDRRRHGRLLTDNVDFPLGGDAVATQSGVYFTRVKVGNPAKELHMQVDTGSDMMWAHCSGCEGCPTETKLNLKLENYDPKGSSSSKVVKCTDQACRTMLDREPSNCSSDQCRFKVTYGDASSTAGYFVQDSLGYVKPGSQSSAGNGNVVFGCATKVDQGSTKFLVDGLMGFGRANSSVISQLANDGKVKRKFSHCLDNKKGGGILAVGELVEPKMKTSPLLEQEIHYVIAMTSIDIDGDVQEFGGGWFSSVQGAVVDSGTTLAYLPDGIYDKLLKKITSKHPDLDMKTISNEFKCFEYSGNLNENFPKIVMNFKGNLTLTAYPHEYMFDNDGIWCIGFLRSRFKPKDGEKSVVLGDMILQNKVVYYDLEDKAVGMIDYDCSTNIKVKDDKGKVQQVNFKNILPAGSSASGKSLLLASLLTLFNLIFIVHR